MWAESLGKDVFMQSVQIWSTQGSTSCYKDVWCRVESGLVIHLNSYCSFIQAASKHFLRGKTQHPGRCACALAARCVPAAMSASACTAPVDDVELTL